MENLIADKPVALEGVIDTLNYLKLRNIPVGLATSSSSRLIKVVLDKLEIKHLFNFVHSAEMEQFGKPHPADMKVSCPMVRKTFDDDKTTEETPP